MSKASNYLEDAVLNHFFRGQTVSAQANVYIALYKTDPTDSDSGTEVTGGAYARQLVKFGAPSQQSEQATISNTGRIEFPKATAAWGEITHFGIRDASSAGNLLAFGAFNKPTTIDTGDRFIVEPGNLTISMG
jgi:hypothetical protein